MRRYAARLMPWFVPGKPGGLPPVQMVTRKNKSEPSSMNPLPSPSLQTLLAPPCQPQQSRKANSKPLRRVGIDATSRNRPVLDGYCGGAFSKVHSNADHLDEWRKASGCTWSRRPGLGKRLRTSVNTPGRDQSNAGDAPGRGWGISPWPEGEVRILSARTHARRDYR